MREDWDSVGGRLVRVEMKASFELQWASRTCFAIVGYCIGMWQWRSRWGFCGGWPCIRSLIVKKGLVKGDPAGIPETRCCVDGCWYQCMGSFDRIPIWGPCHQVEWCAGCSKSSSFQVAYVSKMKLRYMHLSFHANARSTSASMLLVISKLVHLPVWSRWFYWNTHSFAFFHRNIIQICGSTLISNGNELEWSVFAGMVFHRKSDGIIPI